MHNNYYFLRQLTLVLRAKLIGYTISSCFSQEKDELIIGLTKAEEDFYIKASFTPNFSTLSFPAVFNRARANSQNLFKEIIGHKITDVTQYKNERAFSFILENQEALLFKLFGNRANIIHFQEDTALTVFQKKFSTDLDLHLSQMHRDLEISEEKFLKTQPTIQKCYPTFGDIPLKYLEEKNYKEATPEDKWQMLQNLLEQLENPPAYYIIKLAGHIRLSLLPIVEILATVADPLQANQEFIRLYLTLNSFEKNFQHAEQYLHKKIAGAHTYINELEYKILELEYDNSLSLTADLIMANLTNIPLNASKVEVYNFYTNQQIIIELSTKISPQKHAEKLYKKNKNRRIEAVFSKDRLSAKQKELSRLEALSEKLNTVQTNKELKAFLKENPMQTITNKAESEALFREFEWDGFKILVGKNAKNNDLLTQQHTHKEDLWLHAKDVTGSHVVIKYRSGKIFSEPLIEKAAQLAAWYSKRKNDSLCPVLYTPKKYVSKPKGVEPGAVIVEREKVILVKPGNPFSQYPGQENK